METLRCSSCARKLADTQGFIGHIAIKCLRCKLVNSYRVKHPQPDGTLAAGKEVSRGS